MEIARLDHLIYWVTNGRKASNCYSQIKKAKFLYVQMPCEVCTMGTLIRTATIIGAVLANLTQYSLVEHRVCLNCSQVPAGQFFGVD
jgi:hypothetical protein